MSAEVRFPCKGVLFDSDGVLVDSDATTYRAWSRWAITYELDPDAVCAMVHGRRAVDLVEQLIEADGRAAAVRVIDAYELEDAASVTPIPGAGALVRALPPDRWAVVTSAVAPLAWARLRAAGIPDPHTLVTADDVIEGKPSPQGYRQAAVALGLDPGDTVVLEDAGAGVQAARAASVGFVVGVGRRALGTGADVVVEDLRSVRWTAEELVTVPIDGLPVGQ